MTRRDLLALLAIPSGSSQKGLTLNEDPNHFFMNRRKQRLTKETIRQWVDQYRSTLVEELVLCVNAMRSGFPSKTRETWFTGFDPKAGPNQQFLQPLPPAARETWFEWIFCAWQAAQDNLDIYSIWIPEIRRQKLSPWISVRMNDLHDVDKEVHPLHSSFWMENKQFRRVQHRGEQRDKALDYSRREVRDYYFRYIEEICERYDFDTLELDWMRFGFHLPPGGEDPKILTDYHREVRKLLNLWQRKRGHRIGLAVRVPSTPATSKNLGMDAEAWTQLGLVNYVTVTNFWRTVDNNMPVEQWRKLLPKSATLAAGLELGCNAFPGSFGTGNRAWQSNSLETARGSATEYLHRGADKIYLFNYMDSDTTLDDATQYPPLLRKLLDGDQPRRHVLTYQDTWAPGEAIHFQLPVSLEAGKYVNFRLHTGPAAQRAKVRLGLTNPGVTVRLNNKELPPGQRIDPLKPGPNTNLYEWQATQTNPGPNVIEVAATSATRIEWVEIATA